MAEVNGFPQMSDLASNGGITIGQMAGQAKATAAPTYEQQMGTTLNLANMMDQRRQALMTKGILGQQGAMDEQGNLTPAGRTALAGVNPETMGTIENAAAMRAYRENMGQAAENRATAMMNTAKVKQDQLNFKERTQQQLDDNSTFANLLVKATPETAPAVIDTFSKLHQGTFHSPSDIATWNTILGRKPIMDANGQPTGEYEQGPVDPQKLQALQTGVVSQANSFQQATLDRIKQSGVDQNEYKLHEILKPAELEKERADKANEAFRLKFEQDKVAMAKAREQRMTATSLSSPLKLVDKANAEAQKLFDNTRSPLATQIQKVNASQHSMAAILQARDPQTGEIDPDKIPSSVYEELATSVASLLSTSSGGTSSEAQRKGLQQATLSGHWNKVRSYFSGQPFAATSSSFLEYLAEQIGRQGATADKIIESSATKAKDKWVKLGLTADDANTIFSPTFSTYKDYSQLNGVPYYEPTKPMGTPVTAQKRPSGPASVGSVSDDDIIAKYRKK